MIVLSMEQSDTIASSGFMIAEAGRRFLRVSVSVTRPMASIPRLDRIKAWLDENCGANRWAMKKAALEQSASDAARPLFPSEGLDLGDVRTKPISIVGTERQQTVHSQVSRVLALCEIVRKAFRRRLHSDGY